MSTLHHTYWSKHNKQSWHHTLYRGEHSFQKLSLNGVKWFYIILWSSFLCLIANGFSSIVYNGDRYSGVARIPKMLGHKFVDASAHRAEATRCVSNWSLSVAQLEFDSAFPAASAVSIFSLFAVDSEPLAATQSNRVNCPHHLDIATVLPTGVDTWWYF